MDMAGCYYVNVGVNWTYINIINSEIVVWLSVTVLLTKAIMNELNISLI